MIFTTIQIQSFIVIGVLFLASVIVGTYACKPEREEEEDRRRAVRRELRRRY